ncbi:MAG: hypothetical protein J6O71_06230 [Lachnospiraceae bacterium]|nr:hypothetical protein [Lachnospiraceae bacterium]
MDNSIEEKARETVETEEEDTSVETALENTAEDNTAVNTGENTVENTAETTEEKAPQTPTFSYFIRILCGGYLIYLSYGLFTGEGAEKKIILAAAALFALVGIFLIIISVKGLLKKKD